VSLYKKTATILVISSIALFFVFITSVIYSIKLKKFNQPSKEEPKAFQKLVEEQQQSQHLLDEKVILMQMVLKERARTKRALTILSQQKGVAMMQGGLKKRKGTF